MHQNSMPIGARASMEPCGVTVRYRDANGFGCVAEREGFASFADGTVSVEATFDGEVAEVAVTPSHEVVLEHVEVRLRHAFTSDELVLMNGYQSWTDTAERLAWSRMRGLLGVPRSLVRRFAIDAGGDYRLIGYSGRRGELHGFTYATFRRDEGLVLVGSLDESHGFTFIRSNAKAGVVALSTECPLRALAPGERVVVGRYGICRGTCEEAYDRYFGLAGIVARPVRPLVGYTSWYRHYGAIDEAKLLHDLAGMRDRAQECGEGVHGETGPVRLFQVDDGYCKVGDWLSVDAAKFPRGLAAIAKEAQDAGFMPGLWIAPFVCERDSALFRERPEWLLRDEGGEPVRSGPQWSDGFVLDVRNTEVRSYILDVLHTATREWGFRLIKADFLYAACMSPRDGMNCGELMADALELLRAGVGDDVAILGCGVPLGSAFGVVDYCRVGCDVGLDWDDVPHMRLLHRERVSTKNSLANTRFRAPLDGRAFGNDPDVFFLRDDVGLTSSQREELLFADASLGSVLLSSDDRASWGEDARARYRKAERIFTARFEGQVPDGGAR